MLELEQKVGNYMYIGLDLGGTNMTAAVIDDQFNIISRATKSTLAKRPHDLIIKDMYDVTCEAATKAGRNIESFETWGIGMPSYVNQETKKVVHANNFGWINFPIFDYLEKYTKMPIIIENDANCAALGETIAGAGKAYHNTIMITIGTGLGGGIVIEDLIYSGADGMGAELGHTKLVYDGTRCSCGQKGCVESYCSATALIRQMQEALAYDKDSIVWDWCEGDLVKIDGRMIFDAANEKDYVATKVVNQFCDYLSGALSTYITIFRPEAIIIGGGVANAGDILFDRLREKTIINTFAASEIGIPQILPAKLGNDAGIIGAALLKKFR
jgi:glucokinase